jgi:hypothetical protein
MSMETYTLELSEDTEGNELVAELYDIDGLIEASERAVYDDFALSPDSEERDTSERTRQTTADVMALDIQVTRTDGVFEIRVLGNREELITERITDEEWGLTRSDA